MVCQHTVQISFLTTYSIVHLQQNPWCVSLCFIPMMYISLHFFCFCRDFCNFTNSPNYNLNKDSKLNKRLNLLVRLQCWHDRSPGNYLILNKGQRPKTSKNGSPEKSPTSSLLTYPNQPTIPSNSQMCKIPALREYFSSPFKKTEKM